MRQRAAALRDRGVRGGDAERDAGGLRARGVERGGAADAALFRGGVRPRIPGAEHAGAGEGAGAGAGVCVAARAGRGAGVGPASGGGDRGDAPVAAVLRVY